jgi:hypothetical protein
MHCGEPDFPHCQAMIARQQNVIIKHALIENMSELDAHNVVYQSFNDVDPTWIRAKIDADVVLSDEYVLAKIAADLQIRKNALGLTPFVHDYMTDSEIHAGATFYTSAAKFRVQSNPLKCDRDMLEGDEKLVREYGLVGRHMHHANELTAFRYGLHRGLKSQLKILDLVEKAYVKYRDPIRLMAIKGFNVGQNDPRFNAWHQTGLDVPSQHNYEDVEFLAMFREQLNKR